MIGRNLARDNVHIEGDRRVTRRLQLDPVRSWRKRQGLRAAAEGARSAYVVAIDIDGGVGWSNRQVDPAALRFVWVAVSRVRVIVVVSLRIVGIGIVGIVVVRIPP